MAKRDDDDESGAPSEQLVPKKLTDEEVEQKQLALANAMVEMLDLEEKRKRQVKKANDRINELKAEVRELAGQVRTRTEMIPAQMTLDDAVKGTRLEKALEARRESGLKDMSAPVGRKPRAPALATAEP